MGDGFAGVFGRAGELERLWSVEGCCEANFAGLLGMRLNVSGLDECRRRGKERTPLRADFAARLALALCLPPMGAVKYIVNIYYICLALRLDGKACRRFIARDIFQLAPDDVRCQNPISKYQ